MISKSSFVVASQDKLSSGIVSNEIIILDIKSGIYYGLNPVGASIWNFIQQPRTVDKIQDEIVAKYRVEPEQCESDILNLLGELADEGLIEVQNETMA